MLTRYAEIMSKLCEDFDAELKESNGEHNHVHLLVHYPPRPPSRNWSTASRASQRSPAVPTAFSCTDTCWSPSHFTTSCGGAPSVIVRQYIEQQKSKSPNGNHHGGPSGSGAARQPDPEGSRQDAEGVQPASQSATSWFAACASVR
ncbi:transposase [Streptomyces coeruleorubidus]|uniref:transposase n=1 Tax=Streptomyces coeruleorubidus TaxID=116188 RepID=UPI00387E3C5C